MVTEHHVVQEPPPPKQTTAAAAVTPVAAAPPPPPAAAAAAAAAQGPDFTQVCPGTDALHAWLFSRDLDHTTQPPIKKKQGVKRKADTTTADPGGESAEEKKPARQVGHGMAGFL